MIDNLQRLILGRKCDGGVDTVYIDCSTWRQTYPQLIDYRLEVTSPAGIVYFPIVEMRENVLVWEISKSDTSVNGSGKYQVVAEGENDVQKTSASAGIIILPVMPGTAEDEPPDPAKPWTDKVYDAAKKVEDAAKRVEEAGGVTDEQIAAAVEGYLDKNPIEGGTKIDDETPSKNSTYSSSKIEEKFKEYNECIDELIEVSDDKPTEESTELWIKPNAEELCIPEINDEEASAHDTYSSQKIEEKFKQLNTNSNGGAWSLIINQRIAEDCIAVTFDAGDNGEVLSEYDDIIIFIDLCANAGDYTSGVKVSFTKSLNAWTGGYMTTISGQKLSEFTGRNIHAARFEKTGAGILPTVEMSPINTSNVAHTLYISSGINVSDHVNINTPFTVGGPDALEYETISMASEFETIKVGGYQAVMGAGSVIKVWGHKS